MFWLRAFAVWGILLVAMCGNGAVRDLLLVPRWGNLRAHQYSVGTGIVLILGITGLLGGWLQLCSPKEAWQVGVFWVALTLVFECAMGWVRKGGSLAVVVADYKVWEGRLWPLVLLVTGVAPRLWYGWKLG